MHASQLTSGPRDVRLVGVVQVAACHAAFATRGIQGPGQIELIWREFSPGEMGGTFDLVLVNAMDCRAALVSREISRVRMKGWSKGLLVWMDRSQLLAAPKFIAAGATDFILADTEPHEAACRVGAALLRSPGAAVSSPVQSPGITLDWKQRAVLMDDIRVCLTIRELQLLDVMLQTDVPVSPPALAQKAWGRIPSGSENLVSVYVCNLRKKLARFGSAFGIRTHRGAGYSVEVRRA